MNTYTKYGIYLLAGLTLIGLSYGGYLWLDQYILPTPDRAGQKKVPSDETITDVEVNLPEELEQDLEKDRERQKNLFNQAVEAHSAGNYDEAVELYRRTIAHSGRDTIAAKSYRYLADIYSRYEDYERAIRLYNFSLDIDSENAITHYRLGMTQWDNGQLDEAGDELQQAIELEKRANYYLALGTLQLEQGGYEEAEQTLLSGIQQNESLLKLHVNLALARENLEKKDDAIDAYENALEQDPGDSLAYEIYMSQGQLNLDLDNPAKAVDDFAQARNLKNTPDALYNLGLARSRNKNLTGAVEAYQSAFSLTPDDPRVLLDLAHVYRKLKDYENAITFYERALQEKPNSADVIFALARLHEKSGNSKEALSYYEQIVKKEDRGERLQLTYRRVGELYLKLEEPGKAAPAFRNVVSMDTGNAEAHYNLGLSYRKLDRTDQAIEEFRRATQLSDESVEYQLALADSLFRGGYGNEAREAYQKLTEMDPSRKDAFYMIAYLHYRWGDLDQAKNRFQSLTGKLQDDTLLARTYQNLGNIYLTNQQYSEANSSYRQSLGIKETAQTYFNLGLVKVYEEDWEVAATVFRRALNRNPDNPKYKVAFGLVLHQRGLYSEAEKQLEEALSGTTENLRAHYDLGKVRQTLREIEGRTS